MTLHITTEEAVEMSVALRVYEAHARNMADPAALANTTSLMVKLAAARAGERPVRDLLSERAKARLDAAHPQFPV